MSLISYKITALREDDDSSGKNIVPFATVEVRTAAGAIASIFSNSTGTTLSNPFTTDSKGEAKFWVEPGQYLISVAGGAQWPIYISSATTNDFTDEQKEYLESLPAEFDKKEDKVSKKNNLNSPNSSDYPTTLAVAEAIANINKGQNYKGLWNSLTNTPTIVSSTGIQGDWYEVSVASSGTTTIDGIDVWPVGAKIVFNGSIWEKQISPGVQSVNGQTGNIISEADTVATLALLSLPLGYKVSTKGCLSVGDGGHGDFIVEAASGTTDGYSRILLANGNHGVLQPVNEEVNTLQFGAFGNGSTSGGVPSGTDDLAALNRATQYAISAKCQLTVSSRHATSDTWVISSSNLCIVFNSDAAIIPLSSSVLVGVQVGGVGIPTRMNISRLKVDRGSYDGATENIGILFKECNQSTFSDPESRFSKINFKFAPETAGMVYNTLINPQAIAGRYNFLFATIEPGWANENVFLGGRGLTSPNTDTNLRIEGYQSNHNRFYGTSLEGSGQQAVWCDQGTNAFEFLRTEGAWAVDDIVLAVGSSQNMVISCRYDTTVTDLGSRNQLLTYGSGYKFTTGENNKTTLTVNREGANTESLPASVVNDSYSSSGNSYLNEWRHGRDNATSFVFKSIRNSDSTVRSSLTTDGRFKVARQLVTEQSGYSLEPLTLGNYRIWVDDTGRLRIKAGVPTSQTDGVVVGTQS